MRLLPNLALAVVFCVYAVAQDIARKALPAYRPQQTVSGKLRVWGSRDLRDVVSGWERGFAHYHPDIRFETDLRGAASALGGLYTGAADIVFTGTDLSPVDVDGFEETFKDKPVGVEVLTGSFSPATSDFALVVYVHKENPLSTLSLAQLEAIFGSDPRRQSRVIRRWRDLGMAGEWGDKAIHPYGFKPGSEPARFFEDAVMVGSRKWNCKLRTKAVGNQHAMDEGKLILDAAAKDRFSIAYSGMYGSTTLKPIALSPAMTEDRYGIAYAARMYKQPIVKSLPSQREAAAFEASPNNLIERKYPLTRTVSAFARRPPGMPLQPAVREFLRYILSAEGQDVATGNRAYLPLTGEVLEVQRRKLD